VCILATKLTLPKVKVYGMFRAKSDWKSYIVSELSPTTRYLAGDDDGDLDALTTPCAKLAVVCDGGDSTWFYYFNQQ
jgi:hypothetical protein